jgi:hypothetical protein
MLTSRFRTLLDFWPYDHITQPMVSSAQGTLIEGLQSRA